MISSTLELEIYLNKVECASRDRNGSLLSDCFLIKNFQQAVDCLSSTEVLNELQNISSQIIEIDFIREITELSLLSAYEWNNDNLEESFNLYHDALQALSEGIQQVQTIPEHRNTSWLVPTIKVFVKQGYHLTKAIYSSTGTSGNMKKEQYRRYFHSDLMQIFNVCCSGGMDDNWNQSIKHSAQFVLNYLLNLHFQLNTLRGCDQLLNRFKALYWPSRAFPQRQGVDIPDELLCMSEMVMYKYYTGRLSLLNGAFEEAEKDLNEIFAQCPKSSWHNKRKILTFLIPLKLYSGKFPSADLLEKYNLEEYAGLVAGLQLGNLKYFNDTLKTHKYYFMRMGTYFLLEKVHDLVFVEFLRKYKNWFIDQNNINVAKNLCVVDLNKLCKALQLNGQDMDLKKLRCKLYNLIDLNILKGNVIDDKFVVVKYFFISRDFNGDDKEQDIQHRVRKGAASAIASNTAEAASYPSIPANYSLTVQRIANIDDGNSSSGSAEGAYDFANIAPVHHSFSSALSRNSSSDELSIDYEDESQSAMTNDKNLKRVASVRSQSYEHQSNDANLSCSEVDQEDSIDSRDSDS